MKPSFLLTLMAPMFLAGSLHAASADYLLEIDGIKGESSDDRRPEAIDVLSFQWGTSSSSSAGGGAGKVSFSDMHFVTKVSKATPQLMLACATGQSIPQATLYVRNPSDPTQEYFKAVFQDVLITSQTIGGQPRDAGTSADDAPTEEVAFYYNSVTIVHIAPDGTETIGQAVRTPVQ